MKFKLFCERYTCYFCGIKSEPSNSFRSLVEIHHIVEQNVKVDNSDYNLVAACSNCHSLVHMGKINIDKWYLTTLGMRLKWEKEGKTYYGPFTKENN